MSVTRIDSFLVYPGKLEEQQPGIRGTRVPLRDKLFRMLREVFHKAESECEVEIVFRPAVDGSQANKCRQDLLAYVATPSVRSGRAIAMRLQLATTPKSGLGLLFLISGTDGRSGRLVLARFPADQGIIAQDRETEDLDIQFVERVFMKSAKAYKSALFQFSSPEGGFSDGRAVDKQINGAREVSNYWIGGFLESELRTTAAAGTKRLAVALREAVRAASGAVREELVAVAGVARREDGRILSPATLAGRLSLSLEARNALKAQLRRPELFDERFQFLLDEFDRHVRYRSVELDNGATLTAESANFDTVFARDATRGGKVRFSTEGRVVGDALRKTK